MNSLNPPIIIDKFKVNDQITVKVVRDDLLIGGTKQRALSVFLNPKYNEYIYAGPVQGYAQIALANVAKENGKKATIFLPRNKYLSSQTKKAIELGAKIKTFPLPLKELQAKALAYGQKQKDRFVIPFGLYREDFISELTSKIKTAWGKKHKPKRMWIVAGSAALVNAIHRVFPDCFFLIVQVGKTVWPDLREHIKHKFFVAPERFNQPASKIPPYESVRKYDAKVWQFVLKEGQDGDYIWNVGRD